MTFVEEYNTRKKRFFGERRRGMIAVAKETFPRRGKESIEAMVEKILNEQWEAAEKERLDRECGYHRSGNHGTRGGYTPGCKDVEGENKDGGGYQDIAYRAFEDNR